MSLEQGIDVKEEDLEFKLVESIKTHITFFFKVKKENFQDFSTKFNQVFSNDFDLYPIDEVIESKLFGDGNENKIFK